MHFQNLADIHPRRHAQRIEHHIDRTAIGHIGHILDWHDMRNNAFIAMASSHLVTGLQTAFNGHIHFDHFLHARRQFVTLRQLLAFFLKSDIEVLACLLQAIAQRLKLLRDIFIHHADIKPMMHLDTIKILFGNERSFSQTLRAAIGRLADEQALDTRKGIAFDDTQLVGQIKLVTT